MTAEYTRLDSCCQWRSK